MLPNNALTTTSLEADFLYTKPNSDLIDREFGGITLQDTSKGLNYQLWEIYYERPLIKIKGLLTQEIFTILSVNNVKELSLAFDLNMNICITYMVDETTYLYFYDTNIQNYSTITFTNLNNPRISYDDSRQTQSQTSDIIFAYINNNTNYLCCRLLRDRYTIEYPLRELPPNAKLVRVGMNKGLRFQFKIQLL